MGPRTVTANLAFDTDTGWYTLDLPATTITAKDRHYSGPSASFVEHDWVSAPFYVRFPESVHIRRAWVMSALSTGDTFGWSGQGLTGCLPPAGDIAQPDVHGKVGPFSIDPKDRDHLGVPPPADAHILVPKPSTPLEQSTCAQPYRDATVTQQVPPAWPDAMGYLTNMRPTVALEVAIEPDGKSPTLGFGGRRDIPTSATPQSTLLC